MKKIFRYLLFLVLFMVPLIVYGDEIYNVDMHVNIDQYGTAFIEEEWDVKADSGSEWYKTYKNLGNMIIQNYKVYMDGSLLRYKPNWNVNESLSTKAGYYGINQVIDGKELCFGKTDYNRHIFKLEYSITNMIFNTNDFQSLYFTFIPKTTIGNYNIEIQGYYYFPDNLEIWGYGAKGYVTVKNGKILMSNEGLVQDKYVTLLVKFPLNSFNTKNRYNKFNTFDDIFKLAEKGKFQYDYNNKITNKLDFGTIENIILGIIIFASMVYIFYLINKMFTDTGYGYKNNKQINTEDMIYFREIPCNNDIYYANALLKLNNFDYEETNILGAIILKWVKEDKIKFICDECNKNDINKSKIDMRKNVDFDISTNPNEIRLFEIMKEASIDGFLETKEFVSWSKNNYIDFFDTLGEFADIEIKKLKNENHIYNRVNKKECKSENVMDDKIYNDSMELYGLKMFLEDFSNIDTRNVIEVKLWEEYLMFAYLFGIADKVTGQLKNLYPEEFENFTQSSFDYSTLLFINNISKRTISAATKKYNESRSSSSNSGYSSGGGGGGSFGGGGSMGGR